MADYFEEMGWRELQDGEHPDHLLQMARFFLDMGVSDRIFNEWPSLPPPASKEAVKELVEITTKENSKSCPICLKTFEKGEKVTQMPCQHEFHPACILTWLAKTNSCPFCRHELPTDNEGYEMYKKEKKRAKERKEEIDALHNSMFT